jgi:hypothetical protein
MFSGSTNLVFRTDKPPAEVFSFVEDELSSIGRTVITEGGQITIDTADFRSNIYESRIEGTIRGRDGRYQINIDYSSTFSTLGWVIFVLTLIVWFIGLLWLFVPGSAKSRMRNKLERAMGNIRFHYGS